MYYPDGLVAIGKLSVWSK